MFCTCQPSLSLSLALAASSLTVSLVGVLQGAGDSSHVSLDCLCPALHVPDLLETVVKTVNKLKPGRSLLGEVGRVKMQLLGLRIKSFLIEIGLKSLDD